MYGFLTSRKLLRYVCERMRNRDTSKYNSVFSTNRNEERYPMNQKGEEATREEYEFETRNPS